MTTTKGGKGSGHFGHVGRRGLVGGSEPKGRSSLGKSKQNLGVPTPSEISATERDLINGMFSAFYVFVSKSGSGVRTTERVVDAVVDAIVARDPSISREDVLSAIKSWNAGLSLETSTTATNLRVCELNIAASGEFGVGLSEYHRKLYEKFLTESVYEEHDDVSVTAQKYSLLSVLAGQDVARDYIQLYDTIASRAGADNRRALKYFYEFVSGSYPGGDELYRAIDEERKRRKDELGISYYSKSDKDEIRRDISGLDAIERFYKSLGAEDNDAARRIRERLESAQARVDAKYGSRLSTGYNVGIVADILAQTKYRTKISQGDLLREYAITEGRRQESLSASASRITKNKAILRAMYAITQDHFKKMGIEYITLFRGVGTDGKTGKRVKYIGNALESWSSRFPQAAAFGRVVASRIPVSRILSIGLTGLGVTAEEEYVVIGGDNDTVIYV